MDGLGKKNVYKILEELQRGLLRIDIKPFAKHPENPVLTWGASGAWDDTDVEGPSCVFRGEDDRFWMYYHGKGDKFQIGLAYSDDLVSWTKEANNPIVTVGSAGAWDEDAIGGAQVLKVGDTYHMWYGGLSGSVGGIGHATSSDGKSWTKDSANPVYRAPSQPAIWPTHVMMLEGRYWLYYYREDTGETELATSSDGVSWARYGAVLKPGSGASFDSQGASQFKFVNLGAFYLGFYTGTDLTHHHHIGMCLSLDGVNWVKHPQPVLSRNPQGWDGENVVFNVPLPYGNRLYLLYGADQLGTHNCRIGLAETRIGDGAGIRLLRGDGRHGVERSLDRRWRHDLWGADFRI